MQGLANQGVLVEEALTHGDYGIGTLTNLNGEVVILAGRAYHFPPDEDNHLRKLSLTECMPFAMITRFKPTITKHLPTLTMSSLPKALYPLLPTQQNCFLSVHIAAAFPRITFRAIPGQTKPKESLADLAERQSIRSVEDRRGVMFGFWSPRFTSGFSFAGFHLHFVSEDRSCGGHVLDFEAAVVDLRAAGIGDYRLEFPSEGVFHEEPIESVAEKSLQAVEEC
ncbi:hypothetical protein BBP40_010430 [Aspergillus hancockii]|nr:hypothetical protein BBP40_010430 [Aspergillus hancockii]